MPDSLASTFDELRRVLAAHEIGADSTLRKLVQRLLSADPEATLVGKFDTDAERALTAGWVTSRLGWLGRERSDDIFIESAAAVLSSLADTPTLAAAYANLFTRWPTSLARLAITSRERIDGTGEPHARTIRTLSRGQQQVALGVEAARRLSASQGRLEQVIAQFEEQASRGIWAGHLITILPAALAGLSLACDDRRLEPVRARTYRISPAHNVSGPRVFEAIKKRQRIAGRHIGRGPIIARGRTASARARSVR